MWYYQKENTQKGPVDEGAIETLVATGDITCSSLVWKEGMADWANVMGTELKEKLALTPPAVAPPAICTSGPPVSRQYPAVSLQDAHALKTQFTVFWIGLAAGLPLSFIIIGLGGFLLSTVLYFMMLHKFWSIIQDGGARTTPGRAVGFCFIPFFNLYWVFVAFSGLAKDLNKYSRERGISAPEVSEGMALTYCILLCCSIIPYLGVLTALAAMVIWILTVKQMKDAAISIIHAKAA